MAIVSIGPVFPVSPIVFSGRNYPLPSVDSLLQNLASQVGNDNDLFNVADIIDLSPQAQLILAGENGTDSLLAGSSEVTETPNFVLTDAQQRKINDIVLKHRDEPFNQKTFDRIQEDLRAAGLSPDQLALADVARTASLDTSALFLDTLSGNDTNLNVVFSQDGLSEQANADAYIRMIYNLWRATTSQPLVG